MTINFFLFAVLSTLSIHSCDKKEHTDLFEYSSPVDLSYILQAYDWQKDYVED